jgi:hypothetical protein
VVAANTAAEAYHGGGRLQEKKDQQENGRHLVCERQLGKKAAAPGRVSVSGIEPGTSCCGSKSLTPFEGGIGGYNKALRPSGAAALLPAIHCNQSAMREGTITLP